MLEKSVESYLRKRVKAAGGKAYKWVCPGCRGVPDRVVCLPGGRVELVELKTVGGRLSPLQELEHERLCRMGCAPWVLWTREQVDDFMLLVGGGDAK